MRFSGVLALATASCAAQPGISTGVAPLYRAAVRPVNVVCSPTPVAAAPASTLDLKPLEVRPVAWGPRAGERAPDLLLRRPTSILDERDLSACYRWARASDPALAPRLTLHFVVDEVGRVSHTIDRPPPGSDALVDCVSDLAAHAAVPSLASRVTEVTVPLAFAPHYLRAPRPTPRPVAAKPPPPPPGCLRVERAPDQPEVVVLEPQEIDDVVDPAAAEAEEYEEAVKEWERAGRRGRRPVRAPVVNIGSATARYDLEPGQLLEAIRGNAGAYAACARAAKARGTLLITGRVEPGGRITATVVENGTGDAALAECLRGALAEVWAPAEVRSPVGFRLPVRVEDAGRAAFALPARAGVDELAALAEAAVAAGDGDTALRAYAALFRGAPRDSRACRWRLGALRAVGAVAPWLDERTDAALADLAAARPDRACLDGAGPYLASLGQRPHVAGVKRLSRPLIERADVRYRKLLTLPLDEATVKEVCFYLDEADWTLGSLASGRADLVQVVRGRPSVCPPRGR